VISAENTNIKDVLDDKKRAEENDEWGESGDWDFDEKKPVKEIDLNKVDLKTANLNKLDTEELAAYKKAMDNNFKQLKPGDPGFVYDKVVDFSKKDGPPLEDDSWGEDDGVEEVNQNAEGEDEEYYYYEEEVDPAEVSKVQRASNLNADDNDYFDDDFDDDFA